MRGGSIFYARLVRVGLFFATMPATAGRVKMPANNRMQTSASLNTHSIWQNAIGYDPYAGEGEGAGADDADAETGFDQFQGLLKLAKIRAKDQQPARDWALLYNIFTLGSAPLGRTYKNLI